MRSTSTSAALGAAVHEPARGAGDVHLERVQALLPLGPRGVAGACMAAEQALKRAGAEAVRAVGRKALGEARRSIEAGSEWELQLPLNEAADAAGLLAADGVQRLLDPEALEWIGRLAGGLGEGGRMRPAAAEGVRALRALVTRSRPGLPEAVRIELALALLQLFSDGGSLRVSRAAGQAAMEACGAPPHAAFAGWGLSEADIDAELDGPGNEFPRTHSGSLGRARYGSAVVEAAMLIDAGMPRQALAGFAAALSRASCLSLREGTLVAQERRWRRSGEPRRRPQCGARAAFLAQVAQERLEELRIAARLGGVPHAAAPSTA